MGCANPTTVFFDRHDPNDLDPDDEALAERIKQHRQLLTAATGRKINHGSLLADAIRSNSGAVPNDLDRKPGENRAQHRARLKR